MPQYTSLIALDLLEKADKKNQYLDEQLDLVRSPTERVNEMPGAGE